MVAYQRLRTQHSAQLAALPTFQSPADLPEGIIDVQLLCVVLGACLLANQGAQAHSKTGERGVAPAELRYHVPPAWP